MSSGNGNGNASLESISKLLFEEIAPSLHTNLKAVSDVYQRRYEIFFKEVQIKILQQDISPTTKDPQTDGLNLKQIFRKVTSLKPENIQEKINELCERYGEEYRSVGNEIVNASHFYQAQSSFRGALATLKQLKFRSDNEGLDNYLKRISEVQKGFELAKADLTDINQWVLNFQEFVQMRKSYFLLKEGIEADVKIHYDANRSLKPLQQSTSETEPREIPQSLMVQPLIGKPILDRFEAALNGVADALRGETKSTIRKKFFEAVPNHYRPHLPDFFMATGVEAAYAPKG